jgi:nitrogenase-associated protein
MNAMTRVIFFESAAYPHCASQKARLTAMGHDVESFDLINEPWSVSSLRPFFGSKPVHEWFDPLASRVVSGEIDPGCITPQSALVQMILDPTLINGPLIRIGNHCEAGMNADADLGMFRGDAGS